MKRIFKYSRSIKSASIWLCVILVNACVDRIDIDVHKPNTEAISITGYISDQPGPYEIQIQNVFDIESKDTKRTPISVKKIEISDNYGNSEGLNEIRAGLYQTKVGGIIGEVGRAYKLTVELFDGRIYESLPDTIRKAPAGLDSMYSSFRKEANLVGEEKYYMDVFFDASYKINNNLNYIWKFIGTFQAETQPELYYQYHMGPAGPTGNCFYLYDLGLCNYQPPCSGLRNVGTQREPVFQRKFPCGCCECWYNVINDELILSTNQYALKDKILGKKIQSMPLNGWTLMHKIRFSVEQHTLGQNSYKFYKAVQNQKEAIGSLFQPVSGQIPSNFTQLSGPEVRVEGLFYATSIEAKVRYITKYEMPGFIGASLPDTNPIFPDDCTLLFPQATTAKPKFWMD